MSHISSSCMERSGEGGGSHRRGGQKERMSKKQDEGAVCLQDRVKG